MTLGPAREEGWGRGRELAVIFWASGDQAGHEGERCGGRNKGGQHSGAKGPSRTRGKRAFIGAII